MRVLVFGGGATQIPFLQALVRRGSSVVVVGETVHPLVPDEVVHIPISTHDTSAVLRALNVLPCREFHAVACPASGLALVSAAAAAHVLGLDDRFVSESVARSMLVRVELHKALVAAGLARRFVREVDAVVIKSASVSGGSHGVSIHRNCVIEDLVEGYEWKMIGLIVHGRPCLWPCIGTRDDGRTPAMLFIDPADLPALANSALIARLSNFVSDLGLHDGPIQLDVIDSAHGPEVIDLDLVLGGAGPLIRAATGVDLDAAYADLVLGREPDLTITRAAAAAMSYPDRRIVTATTAREALARLRAMTPLTCETAP